MDFIDVSDASEQEATLFCPTCDGKMLFVRKGRLMNNYVCESCGTTINPQTEYIKHESKISNRAQDEIDPDSLVIVQKQDNNDNLSDNQGADSWIERDMRREIEASGRRQVISMSSNSNEAFGIRGPGINRIERPQKHKHKI